VGRRVLGEGPKSPPGYEPVYDPTSAFRRSETNFLMHLQW